LAVLGLLTEGWERSMGTVEWQIDSATVGLDTCVDLIVAASQSRIEPPHAHPVGQN
jgi:hypothetical protein